MSNSSLLFYVYAITYSCPNPCAALASLCKNNLCLKDREILKDETRGKGSPNALLFGHRLGPLLLTWINFNPGMDDLLHAQ